MSTELIAVITALGGLGGLAGILSFIQFMINRKDNKEDKLAEINKRLNKIEENQGRAEMDSVRTQMLVLISDYPEEKAEILKLAEHYFKDLEGDWYMTNIFKKWMKSANIERPNWFRNG